MSNDASAACNESSINQNPAMPYVAAKDVNKIHLNFQFRGKGGEYFRIWIVNILLTILTLGIYSAWAKVRNHRYFYGNTHLNDHSFEYLASPITILKGRLVAVALLIIYILADQFFPLLSIALYIALIVSMPWLICRSMAFRLIIHAIVTSVSASMEVIRRRSKPLLFGRCLAF
ncbi:Inner membrane protein yjgN [Nitrincola nitratireducens]|uniref:Inner membrane protein yjgN n=1 Tax=Nitrincola nitratireducens TaxID=1229521 RepID=W9V0J5_9GAMM|nr:Inner membrane protein yjgN [Nitrincola nitratireducens]